MSEEAKRRLGLIPAGLRKAYEVRDKIVSVEGKRVKVYPAKSYLVKIERAPAINIDGKTLLEFNDKYPRAVIIVLGQLEEPET